MADQISRRKLLSTLVLGGAATTTLAACSSGSSQPTASASTGAAGAQGFPVTIKSALGEATIPSKPTRVATVGWINQDVLLNLGIKPVAMPKSTFGADAEGYLPWTKEAADKLPGDAPVLYADTDGPDVQAIAGAKPDLIIGAYSGLTQDDYNKLSQIAPTVAYPSQPFSTPLQDTMTIIGQAVGEEDKAKQQYQQLQDSVKAEGEKYPSMKGKTFAYTNFTTDMSKFNLYAPNDARVELLNGLGLTTAPSVEGLTKDTKNFYTEMSAEKAPEVQSQMVVMSAPDASTVEQVEKNPVLSKMPAIGSGAVASFTDQALLMATSAVSPLSVPWAFGKGYAKSVNDVAQKVQS